MTLDKIKNQINKDVLISIISANPAIERKTELIELIDYLEFDGDLVTPKINFEALFHIMGELLIMQDYWLEECVIEGNAIDEDYWIIWNPIEECEQIMITLDLARSLVEDADNSETPYLTEMLDALKDSINVSRDYLQTIESLAGHPVTS